MRRVGHRGSGGRVVPEGHDPDGAPWPWGTSIVVVDPSAEGFGSASLDGACTASPQLPARPRASALIPAPAADTRRAAGTFLHMPAANRCAHGPALPPAGPGIL